MNDPVLTLRWFLNCPEIDNLEFFGDEDCLGNPITGVNVIDNPEGVPWIKKNELVLTTGFIFYKDIALTKKLLKELHDVSCTALCIKIKRFYDTIPPVSHRRSGQVPPSSDCSSLLPQLL